MYRLPDGWNLVRIEPDGTVWMTQDADVRVARILFFLASTLIGVSVVAVMAHANLSTPNRALQWMIWLFLTPFALLAVAVTWELILAAFSREEWGVGPNGLEIRQRLLGREANCQYTGAELRLVAYSGEESRIQWSLTLVAQGENRELQQRESLEGETERVVDVYELGTFLSEQTGWPFYVFDMRW